MDNGLVEFDLMVTRRAFFLSVESSTAGGGAFRIQRCTTVLVGGEGGVHEGKDSPARLRSAHDTTRRAWEVKVGKFIMMNNTKRIDSD